jgi:MFS family permease
VNHLFPIICSFFLGSWSDTFGRKWLLYLYFVIRMVEGSAMLLNAHFMAWPKEFLLFSVNLPVALSGGYITFSMGVAAFITEISTPEQRTFRLAMIHFVSSLGSPLGTKVTIPVRVQCAPSNHILTSSTQIGAWLWEAAGDQKYMWVFGAGLAGKAITLVLLITRLEMFKVCVPDTSYISLIMPSCSSGRRARWSQRRRIERSRGGTPSARSISRTA